MKKILFFAFALVASALMFTSCNGNTPSGPTDVTPAMLVGTMWRVDSSYVEGHLDFLPHAVIEVRSTDTVIFNGSDTTHYWIEGNKLYYGEDKADANVVTIKKYTKEMAVVNFADMQADVYLAVVPMPEGQEVARTADNIVGTWKCQYYSYEYSYYDAESEKYKWDGHKHSDPGVVYWTFKADGTFEATNIVFARMDEQKEYATQTGWWEVKDNKYTYGYDEKPAVIPETDWLDISILTTNAFYVGQMSEYYSGTQMSYTYYTRVK